MSVEQTESRQLKDRCRRSILERFSIAWMTNLAQRRGTRNPPPTPPSQGGESRRRLVLSPPCEGGVGGVKAAARAMHLKTALSELAGTRLTPFLDNLELTGPMKPRCSELSHVMGLLGAVVLGLVGIARADIPGYEKSEFMVSMRDGVRLHTLVYRPVKQEGSLPIVLMRTPYGIAAGAPRALDDYLKDLAEEGYIFAFQDIRGRYKSEGQFVMSRPPRDRKDPKAIDESTDASDTIDWLLKNVPENNGRAGMLGISYPGWLTAMAMLDPHPALKAVSPQASPADMFLNDDFHHNGAFRLSYGFEYVAMMETSKVNFSFKFDRHDTFEWYLKLGALSNVNSRYFHSKMPTWNDFVAHPNYDAFW